MKQVLMLVALMCFAALAADDVAAVPKLSVGTQSSVVGRRSPVVGGAEAIAIPQMLSYQGRLTDINGVPVQDSVWSVTFRLYTAPTGGTPFWNETQDVTTEDGLFSVLLGAVTAVDSVPSAGALYLGMAVEGGAELTPRLRIVSAAYTYQSGHAADADLLQGKDTTGFVRTGQVSSVTSAMITDGTTASADIADTNVTMAKIARAGAVNGQVVKWNGSTWAPGNDNVGGSTMYIYQDTGIICMPNPITSIGWVMLDLPYSDARYVNEAQANSVTAGMMVDTNVTMAKVARAGATTGQVIKWTGSAWAPRNDSVGGGSIPDSVPGSFAVTNDLRVYGRGRIGSNLTQSGTNSVVFGSQCTVAGNRSSVLGGWQNSVDGADATVCGGANNYAGTHLSFVGAGQYDSALGRYSAVAGGVNNRADDTAAYVGGGSHNWSSGKYNTVGGGYSNVAAGTGSTVSGGYDNAASFDYGTVGGGYGNTGNGNYGTVGGGRSNATGASDATVGGGYDNTASGYYATVAGGRFNSATDECATVAGGYQNTASALYASVGGGYYNRAIHKSSAVNGGEHNTASDSFAAIGGGYHNYADGEFSTIGGGHGDTTKGFYAGSLSGKGNVAGDTPGDTGAVVAGGLRNRATDMFTHIGGGTDNRASVRYATVGGGYDNYATDTCGTVGGGYDNTADGFCATVGGGRMNTASGRYATIPGGQDNRAMGIYSFAAGRYARARHHGSFVWGDSASTSDSVYTTGSNQFRVRARGGTWFFSNEEMTHGVRLPPNGDDWISIGSYREGGESRPVNGRALLEKVTSLPVHERGFTADGEGTRSIGPTARDFHAAFGYGPEDGISRADVDGVLLAAVQALYEQNQNQQAEIEALKAELRRR